MGLLEHGGLLLAKQTMSLHAHWSEASGAGAHGRGTFGHWGAVPAVLMAIAFLHAATSHEVSVFLLLTIPVAMGTHCFGVRAGVLLAAVALRWRVFTGTVPMGQQCNQLCGEVPSKVCPDCARRAYAGAAYLGQPDAAQVEPESPSDGAHPQEAHA
jgi:hypothetical protein